MLIPGLRREWEHLDGGDRRWLGAALAFELAFYAGYAIVFRAVFDGPGLRIGWA